MALRQFAPLVVLVVRTASGAGVRSVPTPSKRAEWSGAVLAGLGAALFSLAPNKPLTHLTDLGERGGGEPAAILSLREDNSSRALLVSANDEERARFLIGTMLTVAALVCHALG